MKRILLVLLVIGCTVFPWSAWNEHGYGLCEAGEMQQSDALSDADELSDGAEGNGVVIQTTNLIDLSALTGNAQVSVTHNDDGTVTLATMHEKMYAAIDLLPYVGEAMLKPQTSYCLRLKIDACTATDMDGNAVTPAVSLRYRGTDEGKSKLSYGIPTCTTPGSYVGMVFTSGFETDLALMITGSKEAVSEVTISELMIAETPYPIPYVPYAADKQTEIYLPDAALSQGKANILATANQFAQLRYTPIRTLPNQFGDFPAGEERRGVPYSSARAVDKMIGLQVSMHTFMTAIQNPRSVLYTRQLTTNNAKTYYGCVCSVLLSYCYGFRQNFVTDEYADIEGISEIPMSEIDVGDALLTDGHIKMVTGVLRNGEGQLTNVTTTEAGTPCVYVTANMHWNDFLNNHKDYKAYRYSGVDDAGYIPLDYVKGYPDEVLPEITYPDIMSEYGDRAALLEGEDVMVNVIDPQGYDEITVRIDGELKYTLTTMEDFALESCEPGLYEIEMTGANKNSKTTFFVAQATCSFDSDTHMLSFASDNALPEVVYVYSDEPRNKYVPITDAHVEIGKIDLSAYMDNKFKHVKVGFRCGEYGVATWYSCDLQQWVPFGE